jgi:hypothetical protein
MIEKIARALARRRNQFELGIDSDAGWEEYLVDARRAFEAIQEPSDEMSPSSGIDPLSVPANYDRAPLR